MNTSVIFRNEQKRAFMRDWSRRFLARIPAPTEDREFATSYGRTHVLIAGPIDAPPLVVLHGAMASSAHIVSEIVPLLRTRRVYAVDVVGQSPLSEDRRINTSGDDYGRWLIEVCNALELEQVDLFGVSWGGFVAHRAAKIAPLRFGHLILMVPAGVVANSFWAGMKAAGFAFLLFKIRPSKKNLDRMIHTQFTTLDSEWGPYFGEALHAYRIDLQPPPLASANDFTELQCPVLVFGAELDSNFPGSTLLAHAKTLWPQADTELIKGSKHCPPLTDAFREWMSERVERFLSQT